MIDFFSSNLDHQNDVSHLRVLPAFQGAAPTPNFKFT